ncbi:uncharacterized protein VTP21DRAFT_5778 [Calcarisporiella thermophila]|uniref:uncharacterized protein n=1 Tax=Calcarisporiella thermophila TaxID=911321 RepID=UPI0037448B3C
MRIAIITENFLPKIDGVTHTLVRLLEHLQYEGHQTILLGPRSGMTTYAGAQILGTWGIPLIGFYDELKLNFFRPLFLKQLLEFKPDVIHLVDPIWLGAQMTYIIEWFLPDVPVISSYHTNIGLYLPLFGFGFMTNSTWKLSRHLHSKCAWTYCPSQSTANMLAARGFRNLRIWTRGVDTRLFSPEQRCEVVRSELLGPGSENKTLLLYVGRISHEKNLNLLTAAYRSMDHTQVHLVVVGHGPARKEVENALDTYPVTFTGQLDRTALSSIFASADIFVFPSRTETFGQVVLEAMASGLPVVGVRAEGVCDLVQHERTGLLLDVENMSWEEQVNGYRGLLEQLMTMDPERRRNMSEEALAKAQKFTWRKAMETLVRGYREVCQIKKLKNMSIDDEDMDEDLFEDGSVSGDSPDSSESNSPVFPRSLTFAHCN